MRAHDIPGRRRAWRLCASKKPIGKGSVPGSTAMSHAHLTLCEQDVLIVEDQTLIAMDIEQMMLEMGVTRVRIVSCVRDGLAEIALSPPTFALLDIDLGGETAIALADELGRLFIPFIFISGLDMSVSVPAAHADVPRLDKPFDPAVLFRLVADRIVKSVDH
jgi:DNA-binding NtrC family response regulator